jgi:myo-inositol-1(or 4)-monophosphatase
MHFSFQMNYTSRPVQAGIVIAQEAGCLVTGSKDCTHDGDVTEDILTGRKYLVIRGVSDSAVCVSQYAQKSG